MAGKRCGLFVWKQGCAYPIEQNADECNLDKEERKTFRLPNNFRIYSYCENCADCRIEVECESKSGIWKEIIELKTEKLQKLPRKWFDQE